jgi:hypothetical protein
LTIYDRNKNIMRSTHSKTVVYIDGENERADDATAAAPVAALAAAALAAAADPATIPPPIAPPPAIEGPNAAKAAAHGGHAITAKVPIKTVGTVATNATGVNNAAAAVMTSAALSATTAAPPEQAWIIKHKIKAKHNEDCSEVIEL